MLRTLTGVGEIALRSAAASALAGHRAITRGAGSAPSGTTDVLAGMRRLAKVVADEAFLTSEILRVPLISPSDRGRIAAEILEANDLLARRGWLDAPTGYHRRPPPLECTTTTPARAWGLDYSHLRGDSGWLPHLGLPGRERALDHAPNRTLHAWLLQHEGPPRPWLVCVPGYRMGHPLVDFVGFRAAWLHRELGLNVAFPVLPFHGPRAHRQSGDGFLCGDALDLLHAQTQAVWDVRRLIATLRSDYAAPGVGVYGVSLGSYTAGVVAGLEHDLDCVIAGIPAVDWVDLLRSQAPLAVVRLSERLGLPWEGLRDLMRVASPLGLTPAVAVDRRYLFAASADRLAHPEQAEALWRHWGRPRMAWYDGSHVSFMIEPEVESLVREALRETGMLDAPRRGRASRPALRKRARKATLRVATP